MKPEETVKPEDVIRIDPDVDDAWPGAGAGVLLVHGLRGREPSAGLETKRSEVESRLRATYSGQDKAAIAQSEPFPAYAAFYKRFKKTYHVLLQLESVALKGRDIASPNGLVTAMFMAELETGLLSAGHDAEALQLPLRMAVARGGESFVTMGGEEKRLKPGDLFMADAAGIVSSIIYGPDQRTRLGPASDSALFTCYAVPCVSKEAVLRHLQLLGSYLRLLEPPAEVALTAAVWP